MAKVEVVIDSPWKYMEMVVPDVLIARGLVVLPGRDTVAFVELPECERDSFGHIEYRMSDILGHVVEVFDVRIGHHDDVPGSGLPPLPRNVGGAYLVAKEYVELLIAVIGRLALCYLAERTDIPFWLMVVHVRSIARTFIFADYSGKILETAQR